MGRAERCSHKKMLPVCESASELIGLQTEPRVRKYCHEGQPEILDGVHHALRAHRKSLSEVKNVSYGMIRKLMTTCGHIHRAR